MLLVVGDVEVRIDVSGADDGEETPRGGPEETEDPRQPRTDPGDGGDLPLTGAATSVLLVVATIAVAVSRVLRRA